MQTIQTNNHRVAAICCSSAVDGLPVDPGILDNHRHGLALLKLHFQSAHRFGITYQTLNLYMDILETVPNLATRHPAAEYERPTCRSLQVSVALPGL
jgi:hypothetical protein